MRRPNPSGVFVGLWLVRSTRALCVCALVASAGGAQAAVLRVPQDFPTIQAAINAAQSGDTVLVSRGTYAGGLTISGKTITLASNYVNTGDPNDISQTVVSGGNPVLTVEASVGAATTIRGLTFLNGANQLVNRSRRINILDNRFINGRDQLSFESAGGLVRDCFFDGASDDGIDSDMASDPTIENNTILNSANDGIEIRLHPYTGPTLNILIRGNWIAGAREDGIQLIDYPGLSSRLVRIERNVIVNNVMVGIGSMPNGQSNEDFGGAPLQEEVQIVNNTFSGNSHGLTGGDNMLVMNNIFAGASQIGVKRVAGSSLVTYNDFWNNARDHEGSNVNPGTTLSVDPRWSAQYDLLPGSPCIDAGAASVAWNGRTVSAPPHLGAAPDLGAREAAAAPGVPTAAIADALPLRVTEGSPLQFSVTVTPASPEATSVAYAAAPDAPSVEGLDYAATAGTLSFAPGVTHGTVTIPTFERAGYQGSRTVRLRLSSPSGVALGNHLGQGQIDDSTPPPAGLAGKGDMDGDLSTDILWRNTSTGQNAAWLLRGGVVVATPAVEPSVSSPDWEIVGTADFNGDVKTDLLWRQRATGDSAIWFMDGTARADVSLPPGYAFLPRTLPLDWRIVATGDFDQDGNADILWRHQVNGANVIWFMPRCTPSPSVPCTRTGYAVLPDVLPASWEVAGTGDFNGDGSVDIVWRERTAGATVAWHMPKCSGALAGRSTEFRVPPPECRPTGSAALPPLSDPNWRIRGVGDLDLDGKPDVVWQHDLTRVIAAWYLDGVALKGWAYLSPQSFRQLAAVWAFTGPR
jgi:hypothetical protein